MPILQYLRSSRYDSSAASNIQIFDLLQWSRSEKEWRDDCRLAIAHYHKWKQSSFKHMTPVLILYTRIHGEILRFNAHKLLWGYRLVQKERKALFNHYMKALPPVRA